MTKHVAVQRWPRFYCGSAVACLMLLSLTYCQVAHSASASISEGFKVKVTLTGADVKPVINSGVPTSPANPAFPPVNAANNVCSFNSLNLASSAVFNVKCTADEVIASRYYKLPFYTYTSAGNVRWSLPGQTSGIGMGTTSSLRVLREPDDELIEVWVSW